MSTPLTHSQRLARLRVRIAELSHWLVRAAHDLTGWHAGGAPLSLGDPWPSGGEVVRLDHGSVDLPTGWPLEGTFLDLDLGGEGLVRLRYADGSAEGFGHDPNHRRYPLRGRRFAIEAEVVARLPFGQPVPDPRLRHARLVWLEPDLVRLHRRLRLLAETVAALPEHEVAGGLLSTAERSLAALRWPSETATYLSRIADDPEQQALWTRPPGLEPAPPALDEEARASIVTASSHLDRHLHGLREYHPKHGSILLTGHAHLDLAWLWPVEETRRKARRTFHTVLAQLDRHPEMTFNQSTAQLYAWLEEDDPDLLHRIARHVAEGRWEPVGGMWVEPDTNLPTGESLARQLLYGQRYLKRTFGVCHRVAWLPDCFGFSPALPQLLRLAGIDGFFTIKVTWSETNRFPHDLFWWEGLDGSRVLAHLFDNPRGGYNGDPGPRSLVDVWGNCRGKETHAESLLSIGYGDGGGGPTEEMLDDAADVALLPVVPYARFGRVDELFARLRTSAAHEETPAWVGELYLELHRGTLTSQGRTKWLHRRAERALLAAEVLGGLRALLGDAPSPSLEPAWRVLLRNEFHDILPGSGIREVYERAEAELGDVLATAGRAEADHLAALAGRWAGDAGGRPALLAVNSELGARPVRAELSEDVPGAQATDGGWVVATADLVPGLGARVIADSDAVPGVSVSGRHLENAAIRVELAEDGTLAKVLDKRAGRDVLDGRGNQLWAYVDKPRGWDAWDVDAGYPDQGEEIRDLESCEVTERGPHRVAIRLRRRFRSSHIEQELRLWSNSPRLEVRTRLDWHDRRWLLKARFPVAVRSPFATFETAFGVVQRATHRNTSWDAARFEVAGHRFVDLSEPGYGVALLNDGRYGHDVLGSELALSLLRAPVHPDPLADEGEHTFTYALCPHSGDWLAGGVLAEAEDLNQPLRARRGSATRDATHELLRLEGVPLALGCLKPLEEGGGLVLRVYEPQGARGTTTLTLPERWRAAEELDLLERPAGPPDPTFRPFQVHTWRLEQAR
jgi:alpha-mannosidase